MNTITKEVTNSVEAFEDYFKNNDIVYYKREPENNITLFLLPYRIQKQYRININLFTTSESSFCRMFFECNLNTNKDYSKRILEINSDIDAGSLSIEPKSDIITFRTDFSLSLNSDINSIYDIKLYECFMVFQKLINENIIKVDTSNEY